MDTSASRLNRLFCGSLLLRRKVKRRQLLSKLSGSLWEEIVKEWLEDISEDKPKTPPQILVDNFSFEELHSLMKRNNNQQLGMFIFLCPYRYYYSLYAKLEESLAYNLSHNSLR